MIMRTVFPVAVLAVLTLAGCGGSVPARHHASPTAANGANCIGRVIAWGHAGGEKHLSGVAGLLTMTGTDLKKLGHDTSNGRFSAMAQDTTNLNVAALFLKAAAKLALADPPPSCAPAMAANYKTAMQDFMRVDADLTANDYQAASSDIAAGGNAISRAASAVP